MKPLFLSAMLATGVIALGACTPADTEKGDTTTAPVTDITPTAVADIPDAVRAVALATRPGMIIAEAELKEREGRRYYDVEGTLNGAEIELDMLETPQGWQVVEIQRDIPWPEAPVIVSGAVQAQRAGFAPVRVIESTQADDGSVIYELFAEGQPDTPAVEVRVRNGRAEILKEVWPH